MPHIIAVDHSWQPDCLVKMQALCSVLETGKNLTDRDVLVLPMDVTAIDQLEFHFQQVIEHFGKVKTLFECPSFLFIKPEAKIFKSVMLPIVLYVCEIY